MTPKTLRRICNVIIAVGLLNFASFAVSCAILGGDAVSGKIVGGRYYLGSHGRLTEVTREKFRYSQAHAISVFITYPLAILVGIFVYRKHRTGAGRKRDWISSKQYVHRPYLDSIPAELPLRPKINDEITASPVRVISGDGDDLGVMAIGDALKLVGARREDLVELNTPLKPPICWSIDYGRYRALAEQSRTSA